MKMKTSYVLMSLLTLAACSAPEKKEAEATDEPKDLVAEIVGSEVVYSSDSIEMKGYVAFDKTDSTKKPGILVVHEWWGHNDYARERAEMLADLGYVALAVDMYGDGKQADHPGEAGEFATMVMSNMDEATARFESAVETLKQHPYVDPEKIGAIGYCFGGSIVLSMANAGYDLDAVAAFHAGIGLPIMPDSGVVKGKILIANGGADPMISEQQVADFKTVMDAAGVDYKYISYDGVLHSFTNKDADAVAEKFEALKGALAYDAEADSLSWEEMKTLFASSF